MRHGDASSCNRVDELRDLSAARDQQLDDCVGQTSSSCVKARTDLRVAAATYLDAALSGDGDDLDDLSLLERHMVFLSVWKYADSKDDTSGQNLVDFAATLKSEQARALLTGTMEEIAKVVRDPIMLGVILYGGHGNAKAIVGSTGLGNGGASTTPRDVPDILSMFPKRSDRPQLSGTLRTAANSAAAALKGEGKINFGMGSFSHEQTMVMGEAWVGSGYRINSSGIMVSADGLRQFRPPSFKEKLGMYQANFEQRLPGTSKWGANGHVDILE